MRGYQNAFYESHSGVRDITARAKKANKIRFLLKERISIDMKNIVALDIGCSSGLITCALEDLFRCIVGLEYDAAALQKRPRSGCNAIFIQGDAMMVPFANQSIDLIICAQVYEHVPSDNRLVEEMFRILKPGGNIFFSGPNKLYPIELHYNLPFIHWLPQRLADGILRFFHLGDHYYERSRTVWGLRKLFHKFEIIDLTGNVLLIELETTSNSLKRFFILINLWFLKVTVPLIPNFNWILKKVS